MGSADDAERLLDAVLADFPGATSRAGQRQMVRTIAEAIDAGEHRLVQAGTGTGKSLGYLVPAVARQRRVVVSTATKALQAQLVDKDLPRVAVALEQHSGRDLTFAIVKGRANYLCLERAQSGEGQAELDVGQAVPRGQLDRLRAWADETETGDRDELDFAVDDSAWRSVSVDGRNCLGSKCAFREDCFAEKARAEAAEADVVVANHSMLALDVCTEAQLLPERDLVVVDEAHELDGFVTQALTAEVSSFGVATAVRLAGTLLKESSRERLGAALSDLDGLLHQLPTGLLNAVPDDARVLLHSLQSACEAAASELSPGEDEDTDGDGRHLRAKNALREIADAAEQILDADEHAVLHVTRSAAGQPGRLRVSPLRIGGALAARLLTDTPVVLTSATLAYDGGFDHIARQLGFTVEREESRPWSGVDVGSPFDYPRQAQLYIATDLPDPKDPAWKGAVDQRVAELIEAAGGRCLALFSSRAAADRAAAYVRENLDLPVLLQGEDVPARLVWRFASDARTSLFATRGFWHGVDVPGSACQLVVIDRLPFSHVDDPLHKARVERAGRGGFAQVAVPEAAMALAQGVGRLIRTAEDRGVVAVLDPRLATASYATRLLHTLPPMFRTTNRERVLQSLRAIDASAPPVRAAAEPARRRRQPRDTVVPQREPEELSLRI